MFRHRLQLGPKKSTYKRIVDTLLPDFTLLLSVKNEKSLERLKIFE